MSYKAIQYTVKEMDTEVCLEQYILDCVDVPKFLACCQECPSFGATWSCPPYDFDPMDVWHSFGGLRLYARMLVFDFPGQDEKAAIRALYQEKAAYLDVLLGYEAAIEGSLALSAGSCNLCEHCLRGKGIPCCRPERMRYSIESLGGDVGKTAELYLGQPLHWIQNGVLPAHLMLVGALLLPKEKESESL